MKRKKVFHSIFLIFLSVPVFLCGKAASKGIVAGIRVAGATVIPALFPYFVLSNLFLQSGMNFPKVLRQSFRRLFHTTEAGLSAFVFSLIGGYPLGAKTVSELYSEKKLTAQDAASLLRFCNNTGPAFFLGVAGGKILGSTFAGAALYCIHIASAMLCGILFRPKQARQYSLTRENTMPFSFARAFPQSVLRASTSILNISAFVILFSGYQAAMDSLHFVKQAKIVLSGQLRFPVPVIDAICSGVLEMTSGLVKLKSLTNKSLVFALASFLISWGGMCVHFQTLSQLNGDISTKGYYAAKLFQGVFAFIMALPIGEMMYHHRLQPICLLPLTLIPGMFLFRCFVGNSQAIAGKHIAFHKNIPKNSRKGGRNSEKNLV
ncbi:MAG: hypothetical protein MJ085_00935 [Clostridia bacterium]|nr:hypothetical protein [Clostridia bacterium]